MTKEMDEKEEPTTSITPLWNPKDWQFIIAGLQATNGDIYQGVQVVHKRFFQLFHRFDNSFYVGNRLGLPLAEDPYGETIFDGRFGELQKGFFAYKGEMKDAIKTLEDLGLTQITKEQTDKMSDPVDVIKLSYQSTAASAELTFFWDEEITKKQTEESLRKVLPDPKEEIPRDWSREKILSTVNTFAKEHNLAAIIRNEGKLYEMGKAVCHCSEEESQSSDPIAQAFAGKTEVLDALAAFRAKYTKSAAGIDAVLKKRNFWKGTDICFVSQELANTLPAFPEGYGETLELCFEVDPEDTELIGGGSEDFNQDEEDRQLETMLHPNDMYYMIGAKEDQEDDGIYFLLVEKNFWEKNHYISDQHISHRLSLDDRFDEVMESTFEFEGESSEGEVILQKLGYTKLENPKWYDQSSNDEEDSEETREDEVDKE